MTDRITPLPGHNLAPAGVYTSLKEELSTCPVCNSQNIDFHLFGRSAVSQRWASYYKCQRCKLLFVNPPLDLGINRKPEEDDAEIRDRDYFIQKNEFDAIEFRSNIIKPVLNRFPKSSSIPKPKWLDVGCAIGNLLDQVALHNFEPYGIEPNKSMQEWVKNNRPHINIWGGLDDLPPGQTYDIISADNVLEHISEPVAFLQGLRTRLAKHSFLILRVPNLNNALRPLLQCTNLLATSFMIAPEDHPFIYSKTSLTSLFGRCELTPIVFMEGISFSYALKNVISRYTFKWPSMFRSFSRKAFPLSAIFDNIISAGGLDITVIAKLADKDSTCSTKE